MDPVRQSDRTFHDGIMVFLALQMIDPFFLQHRKWTVVESTLPNDGKCRNDILLYLTF
jgi:hypothetical protein